MNHTVPAEVTVTEPGEVTKYSQSQSQCIIVVSVSRSVEVRLTAHSDTESHYQVKSVTESDEVCVG